MSDRSFQFAVRLVDDAKRSPPGEAVRIIFDHYRTSSQAMREAIVLALIGEVATNEARRRSPAPEATETA